jgi:hypothetical protein
LILNAGDIIKPGDQLKFEDSSAGAVVISSLSGKYTLNAPGEDLFSDELVADARSALKSISNRTQLSSRAEKMIYKDLGDLWNDEVFFIIGPYLSVDLDKSTYPLSDVNYIAFDYMAEEEEVNKKLEFDSQVLKIDKFTLIDIKECKLKHDTLQGVSIFQYNLSEGLISKISETDIIFVHKSLLTDELLIIKDILKKKGQDRNSIINYMAQYFLDVYGNTEHGALMSFIENEVYPDLGDFEN